MDAFARSRSITIVGMIDPNAAGLLKNNRGIAAGGDQGTSSGGGSGASGGASCAASGAAARFCCSAVRKAETFDEVRAQLFTMPLR